MMQAFRNAAKPVLYVLTFAFFIWLVWDLSGLGGGSGTSIFTQTTVGKINGQTVDVRNFDQRVQNAITEQQQRGGSTSGLDQVTEIRDRVWDQTVQEVLLRGEYDRRGLRVSDEEIADAIRNVPLPEVQQLPDLQTNGKFDPEKYHRWLASSVGQSIIPGLEAQYREQLLQAKLFRSVVADVFLSDAALWERYRDEREQVKIGLARIDANAHVSDQAAPVTAQEAEAYFNQHKDEFKRTNAAYLSYVALPRRPDASDSAAALARVRGLKDEIDKGAPFEEVAKRESSDSVSGPNGGSLGELNKSQVVAEFATAALALPLNTVSEPVATQFGYHLIKVESRKGETFTARHILVPIEITGAHRDQLDRLADTLETLAADKPDPAALDTAARALKLTVRTVGPVAQGSRVSVPEGGPVPDAGVWAFEAKRGEQSAVIEGAEHYFVFRLDSLVEEGIPSFAEARPAVEARVRAAKKLVEARKLGEKLGQQVAAGTPLEQGAKTLGFEYRELGPFARLTAPINAPGVIGAAFGLKQGTVSAPIENSDPAQNDHSVYLIQVLSRTPADSAEFTKNLGAIREQALQAARRSRVQAYMTALRDEAKIVDNRKDIYRTSAQRIANQ
jgi:peptidyl-prolyl cis-trans isomerase D